MANHSDGDPSETRNTGSNEPPDEQFPNKNQKYKKDSSYSNITCNNYSNGSGTRTEPERLPTTTENDDQDNDAKNTENNASNKRETTNANKNTHRRNKNTNIDNNGSNNAQNGQYQANNDNGRQSSKPSSSYEDDAKNTENNACNERETTNANKNIHRHNKNTHIGNNGSKDAKTGPNQANNDNERQPHNSSSFYDNEAKKTHQNNALPIERNTNSPTARHNQPRSTDTTLKPPARSNISSTTKAIAKTTTDLPNIRIATQPTPDNEKGRTQAHKEDEKQPSNNTNSTDYSNDSATRTESKQLSFTTKNSNSEEDTKQPEYNVPDERETNNANERPQQLNKNTSDGNTSLKNTNNEQEANNANNHQQQLNKNTSDGNTSLKDTNNNATQRLPDNERQPHKPTSFQHDAMETKNNVPNEHSACNANKNLQQPNKNTSTVPNDTSTENNQAYYDEEQQSHDKQQVIPTLAHTTITLNPEYEANPQMECLHCHQTMSQYELCDHVFNWLCPSRPQTPKILASENTRTLTQQLSSPIRKTTFTIRHYTPDTTTKVSTEQQSETITPNTPEQKCRVRAPTDTTQDTKFQVQPQIQCVKCNTWIDATKLEHHQKSRKCMQQVDREQQKENVNAMTHSPKSIMKPLPSKTCHRTRSKKLHTPQCHHTRSTHHTTILATATTNATPIQQHNKNKPMPTLAPIKHIRQQYQTPLPQPQQETPTQTYLANSVKPNSNNTKHDNTQPGYPFRQTSDILPTPDTITPTPFPAPNQLHTQQLQCTPALISKNPHPTGDIQVIPSHKDENNVTQNQNGVTTTLHKVTTTSPHSLQYQHLPVLPPQLMQTQPKQEARSLPSAARQTRPNKIQKPFSSRDNANITHQPVATHTKQADSQDSYTPLSQQVRHTRTRPSWKSRLQHMEPLLEPFLDKRQTWYRHSDYSYKTRTQHEQQLSDKDIRNDTSTSDYPEPPHNPDDCPQPTRSHKHSRQISKGTHATSGDTNSPL